MGHEAAQCPVKRHAEWAQREKARKDCDADKEANEERKVAREERELAYKKRQAARVERPSMMERGLKSAPKDLDARSDDTAETASTTATLPLLEASEEKEVLKLRKKLREIAKLEQRSALDLSLLTQLAVKPDLEIKFELVREGDAKQKKEMLELQDKLLEIKREQRILLNRQQQDKNLAEKQSVESKLASAQYRSGLHEEEMLKIQKQLQELSKLEQQCALDQMQLKKLLTKQYLELELEAIQGRAAARARAESASTK